MIANPVWSFAQPNAESKRFTCTYDRTPCAEFAADKRRIGVLFINQWSQPLCGVCHRQTSNRCAFYQSMIAIPVWSLAQPNSESKRFTCTYDRDLCMEFAADKCRIGGLFINQWSRPMCGICRSQTPNRSAFYQSMIAILVWSLAQPNSESKRFALRSAYPNTRVAPCPNARSAESPFLL